MSCCAAPRPSRSRSCLTPGSFNETYFEHAYLARQLGFPLVEGHDLTVRGEYVFLKTLAGLKRVHAIMRRLDDDFCDPVELRADSALGVPGLLGAIRKGNVAVANALGSGVLESAAWLGFLPAVAERLIGERLSLPSVASWWCGEEPAFEAVIANLPRLVIKPAFPNQNLGALFGRDLSTEERAALIARIRARPHAFVAQEHLAFSQAPVWYTKNSDGFSARALGIRVYAIATPHGYRVMPGRARAFRLLRACGNRLDAARRRQQGCVGVERSRAARRGAGRGRRGPDRSACGGEAP